MVGPMLADAPRRRSWSRGFVGFTRYESTSGLQLTASAAIIVICAAIVGPVGLSGRGLAVLILLVVNSLVLVSRHLPTALIPSSRRFPLLLVGAGAGAALLAVATTGSPYLFAFYVAGHAGFRLDRDRAIVVAVACSVLCGGVLLLHLGTGHALTPWLVGAATGVSVLIGMISRVRQEMLTTALSAAAAAERAAQAEAREAVLAERGRIARDVHDVLAHSLAGINMQLEVADALLDTGDVDRAREATRKAQSLVRESLVESQRTVRALREDALPLVETLRAMLESSGHPDGLEVVGAERAVETRPAQALVRIAQEALTNAAKHAPGAAVRVTLTFDQATVGLEVVNAAPLSRPTIDHAGSGMGLVGMRERAALLAGSLGAGPVTDGPFAGGWRIHVIIAS
jgi:signal transduction histidine kinase